MRLKDKENGVIAYSELNKFSGKIIYWSFFYILLITAIISIVPTLWTILTAFKTPKEIYSSFSLLPKELSWEMISMTISEALRTLDLVETIPNTLLLSFGNLMFNTVVCGFAGYALSKIKPKGHKIIFTLIVWTMMMPSQIRLVPNYISYLHFPFAFDIGGINLLNTFWPMWLSSGADMFAVLLYKNAFDGLSDSYVEAAKLDGCSNYGIFFKIMLPLVMPILMFQSISVLSGAWSDFFTPMLILDDKMVLPLKVFLIQSNSSLKMNAYFMALIFASIPSFLFFVFFQKWIIGGVNVGGVKG